VSQPFQLAIRDALDSDAEALISLIGAVFDEYPGCVLDVDGEMPQLRAVATTFRGWGGKVWVVERDGRVVACVACTPARHVARCLELRMLYVEQGSRRAGIASSLCDLVEDEARARGAIAVELWTDTRFDTAHRLYERRGYVRGPETRELHDKSDTVEFYYRRSLQPKG
jgi:putative acetyltransferase